MSGRKRQLAQPKDEFIVETEEMVDMISGDVSDLQYTVIAEDSIILEEKQSKQPKLMDLTTVVYPEFADNQQAAGVSAAGGQESAPSGAASSSQSTPQLQTCSLCGTQVADLASHIVDDHTELQDLERAQNSQPAKLKTMKPVRVKGPFRQVKPVLRYPCDGCRTVAKTSDQLKKHMILVHNGHKNTSWMFCGDCDFATRMEEELINHVKIHQMFNILKEDIAPKEDSEDEEDEAEAERNARAILRMGRGQSGAAVSDFSSEPMNCGDCDFQTNYESELFEHLKVHLGTENDEDDSEMEENNDDGVTEMKKAYIMLDGNEIVCHKCGFRTSKKATMARHCRANHEADVASKKKMFRVHQTCFYCTLCPFKGKNMAELDHHKKTTIHLKDGSVNIIKHNPHNPKFQMPKSE